MVLAFSAVLVESVEDISLFIVWSKTSASTAKFKLSWITRITLLSTFLKKTLALDTRYLVTSLRPHPSRRNLNTQLYFLRLGLPSTLTRNENGAFRKRSSNRRNFKTLRFRVDGKYFENGAFRKRSSNRRNLKTLRFRVDGKHFGNGAFRKRSSNRRNLKTLRFRVAGKHFGNGAFRKRSSNRKNLKTRRFRVAGKHFKNEAFRKR